jgi:hypothetical protein
MWQRLERIHRRDAAQAHGVGTFHLESELDKPVKMTGVKNGVFNDVY